MHRHAHTYILHTLCTQCMHMRAHAFTPHAHTCVHTYTSLLARTRTNTFVCMSAIHQLKLHIHHIVVTCSFNWTMDNGHSQVIRGMDYNPNQMYHFATCGDDCCAKFWDARKLDKPLITRQDHSHWLDHGLCMLYA